MAKLLPPQIRIPSSSSLLFPLISTNTQKSIPFASSTIKTNIKFCFTRNSSEVVMKLPKIHSANGNVSFNVVQDDVAEELGEVSIFRATGEPVKFSDLWDQKEGMAVVALMRHFGCFCSWENALSLKEAKGRFDSSGVKLIAIGVGTPDKAQILAERLPFPLDCLYADPDRKAYDVLGLYYGVRRTLLSDKTFSRKDSLKKAMENYTIKATPNITSVFQQGGMFVFKGKQLLYARKDEVTGDHAPLEDVFDVCCKVPIV